MTDLVKMLYISVHASPYNYKVMHEQKQTLCRGPILLAPHFPTPPHTHTHTHTHGDRVGEDPRNEVETESGQVGIAKNIFASN